MRTTLLLAFLFAGLAPLAAQRAASPMVSVGWLADHVRDGDLVLLHVGPAAEYAKAHLPGARLVDGELLRAPRGALSLEMPDAAQLRRDFATLGITDRSTVVVVSDQEWVTPSTRVWVTLQYAGLGARARVLDGGQPEWVAAGHPVTAEVPAPGGGGATPRLVPGLLADLATVQAVSKGGRRVRIIDARAPVFYEGPGMDDHGAGHIPGAVNIPFTTIVGDRDLMLSPDELRARFTAAGIAPGDSLIVYCHVGQQATLVFTAATILGHPVRLFDGSMDAWEQAKLPLENAKGR